MFEALVLARGAVTVPVDVSSSPTTKQPTRSFERALTNVAAQSPSVTGQPGAPAVVTSDLPQKEGCQLPLVPVGGRRVVSVKEGIAAHAGGGSLIADLGFPDGGERGFGGSHCRETAVLVVCILHVAREGKHVVHRVGQAGHGPYHEPERGHVVVQAGRVLLPSLQPLPLTP